MEARLNLTDSSIAAKSMSYMVIIADSTLPTATTGPIPPR